MIRSEIHKSDVNSLLYALEKEGRVRFSRASNGPPLWESARRERTSLEEAKKLAASLGATLEVGAQPRMLRDGARFAGVATWTDSFGVVLAESRPQRSKNEAEKRAAHLLLGKLAEDARRGTQLKEEAWASYKDVLVRGKEFHVGDKWPFPERTFEEHKGGKHDTGIVHFFFACG